jgi:16S rRNA (cytosine1402-N4)-methyltransferase
MKARRDTSPAEGVRGGTLRHVPVLLPEVLAGLSPQPDQAFIDGTFGAGGYTAAILRAARGTRVLAIDRDASAVSAGLALAREHQGRLILAEGRFGDLESIAEEAGFVPVDGVVLDIGVSSMQLDDPARGFSFQGDGPLDMRMGGQGPTAAEIVNTESESTLADIFFHLGDERRARAVARAIAKQRADAPFARTSELAQLAEKVLGRPKIAGRHAATRIFQALRIYVNDELGELARGLAAAERVLRPDGRLAVVTFHSLEDGMVKAFLRARSDRQAQGSRHLPPGAPPQREPSFRITNSRPVTAGDDEVAANPRARSAKLRLAVRTEAPPWPEDEMPAIPRLQR